LTCGAARDNSILLPLNSTFIQSLGNCAVFRYHNYILSALTEHVHVVFGGVEDDIEVFIGLLRLFAN
jgi:hypothetical protein